MGFLIGIGWGKRMKFYTAVVTFNRKEEMIKNLNAQLRQTLLPDLILIIDNHSTDGTYDFLVENKVLENPIIRYLNTEKNDYLKIDGVSGCL